MKYLYLILLLITGTACKEESSDSTTGCSCLALSAPNQIRSISNIRGNLKLTPLPLDRIDGKVYVYIDEKHVFSDERHRLLEQEISINYEEENIGVCGTTEPVSPTTNYYESPEPAGYYENRSCDCAYGLQASSVYNKPAVTAVARGDLESVDRISLQLNFEYPDYRSIYYIGIHIDRDGDGSISEGDYYTKEFVEIDMTNADALQLNAERIQTERTIATGTLKATELPASAPTSSVQIMLLDISVPGQPRTVATSERPLGLDYNFSLQAIPETEKATWQLTAWIDNNADGALDKCDYVEAKPLIWYRLEDLNNVSVPLMFAGGSADECALADKEIAVESTDTTLIE